MPSNGKCCLKEIFHFCHPLEAKQAINNYPTVPKVYKMLRLGCPINYCNISDQLKFGPHFGTSTCHLGFSKIVRVTGFLSSALQLMIMHNQVWYVNYMIKLLYFSTTNLLVYAEFES